MRVKTARFELDEVPRTLACPKCDANVYLQHDGTLLTGDVAHRRETIGRALEKLDELLLEGWRGYYKGVRIVVGGGSIREEVRAQLRHYAGRGIVREHRDESANPGAIVAILRD
jgi:hypothetical protein